jgi:hypothetical protein
MIDFQTPAHDLRIVIIPSDKSSPAPTAPRNLPDGIRAQIEDGPTAGTNPALREPLNDRLIRNLDVQDDLIPLMFDPGQAFCLGDGPWKSIQDIAVPAIRPCDSLSDHIHHHIIAHQFASIHEGLGLTTQGSSLLDGIPQQIPGRDLGETVPVPDKISLRTLAAAGRAEQNNPHPRLPFKRLRRMNPS